MNDFVTNPNYPATCLIASGQVCDWINKKKRDPEEQCPKCGARISPGRNEK